MAYNDLQREAISIVRKYFKVKARNYRKEEFFDYYFYFLCKTDENYNSKIKKLKKELRYRWIVIEFDSDDLYDDKTWAWGLTFKLREKNMGCGIKI